MLVTLILIGVNALEVAPGGAISVILRAGWESSPVGNRKAFKAFNRFAPVKSFHPKKALGKTESVLNFPRVGIYWLRPISTRRASFELGISDFG